MRFIDSIFRSEPTNQNAASHNRSQSDEENAPAVELQTERHWSHVANDTAIAVWTKIESTYESVAGIGTLSAVQKESLDTQNQWQNQALLPPTYPQDLRDHESWTDPRTELTWERESLVGDFVVGQFHDGETCIRAEAQREIVESPGYQSWYENLTGEKIHSVVDLPTPGYQACYDANNQLTESGTFDSASPSADPWAHFSHDVAPVMMAEPTTSSGLSADAGAD